MRIINVIETINDVVENVESFPILEDQFSQEIVEKAENRFLEGIQNHYQIDEDWDDVLQEALENGYFSKNNGDYYTVYLVWSNVNL